MNKFLLQPQAGNHQLADRHHGGNGQTVSDSLLLLDHLSLIMVRPHHLHLLCPPWRLRLRRLSLLLLTHRLVARLMAAGEDHKL
jgi:hypothetical protein